MSGATAQQLWRQWKALSNQGSPLIATHIRATLINDDVRHWHVLLRGPENTPHEHGLFHVNISFPQHGQPVVRFLTPMFHPNVDSRGLTSLCVLADYSRDESIMTLLSSLVLFLNSPAPNEPLNSAAAALYMNNRPGYDEYVRRYTWSYAHASLTDAQQVYRAARHEESEDEDMMGNSQSNTPYKKKRLSASDTNYKMSDDVRFTNENDQDYALSMDFNYNTLAGLATSGESSNSITTVSHQANGFKWKTKQKMPDRKLSGSKRKFSCLTRDDSHQHQQGQNGNTILNSSDAFDTGGILKRMRVNAKRMFNLDSKTFASHATQWNHNNQVSIIPTANGQGMTLPLLNTNHVTFGQQGRPAQPINNTTNNGQLTPLIFDYSQKMFLS